MEDTKKQKIFIISIIIILVASIIGAIIFSKKGSGKSTASKYDNLAMCIQNSGAKFYGAFWCPHCQNQKKMFGASAKLLPYVECSTPNGQGQLPVCKEKNIEGYPTWIFANGERKTGEVTIEELASKTNCSNTLTQ